ncbi:MAG: hypothetical protein K2H17_05955 [Duncaniella sp.]|uniref:hypothetical protein n=1 Tax=Duncaniella sp. TaxID=2518496 RepID=UPI0023CFAE75|nr:hypothetical protein [Duncaniella sp.]MDE5988922.1 hypothetical protein [Duncaniella sp.]
MTTNPTKAVLLRSLTIGCLHIQKGVEVDLFSIGETGAFISVDRNSFCVPQHFITIIPPDSTRVHKRKKKQTKRKKK